MPVAKNTRDFGAEIAYLTRALKAPTLRGSVDRVVERATAESWSYPEFLAACLQREVSARESHGGESRIRAARFPARKSLEEFDYDHARGLKRESIAHLGTLDFVTAKDNIVFLGPPGTGKTHLATGLAIRACQAGHRVLLVQHRRPITETTTSTPVPSQRRMLSLPATALSTVWRRLGASVGPMALSGDSLRMHAGVGNRRGCRCDEGRLR